MRHALSLVSLLALGAPAHAQTVDAQGAGQLMERLSRYFGSTVFDKGIVKVAPDGDAYRLVVDAAPLLALIPAEQKDAFSLKIDPYALRLKPGVGGKWDVSGPLMPNIAMTVKGPQGEQSMDWTIGENSFTGVYDPAIASFTNASGTHGTMKMLSKDPSQTTDVTVESGSMQMESVKSANGGVDVTMKQTMNGFGEAITVAVPNGPTFTANVKAPTVTVNSKAAGARSQEFLDLLAFGVANADETKIKANQAELKTRLLALLPIWDNVEGNYVVDNVTVETQIGSFSATTVGADIDFDGISKNGALSYGISVTGLTVPANVVPGWAAPLLPTDFKLAFGGSNLDSDTAVRAAIAAFDLNQTPPISDAVGQKIASDFLAKNPSFTIGRSFLRTADSEIAFDGEFTYRDARPSFQATIDAKGFDKIVETMQAAASVSPEASQVFPVVLAAKGLGKAMPDGSLQWLVDLRPNGAVLVNGAMVKPADPIPAPPPLPTP